MELEQIGFSEIDGVRVGNAQDDDAMTGVTVMVFDAPNAGGVDISGGGPASRESHLLSPLVNAHSLNALVFSGGSAFGLDAASGVMRYLEERGMGYHILGTVVPLVCQSCIFDLGIGSARVRPDAAMGYAACVDAENNRPRSGIVGAGTGATVGKVGGIGRGQKSGIGYFAARVGALKLGAVAVVNAYGDVVDHRTGNKLAGMMNRERTGFVDAELEMIHSSYKPDTEANTTLAAIFTNGAFTQAEMNTIASVARGAYGRCMRPAGTMADGDTIYAFSMGQVTADMSAVGALATAVLSEAILDAVNSSHMADGEFLAKLSTEGVNC